MKKMLLIGVAALLATISVQAGPTEGSGAQNLGLPSVLYPGTTNLATKITIDVSKQQQLAFQFTSTALATPGCTNLYLLEPSTDGISFDTNNADLVLVSNAVVGIGPVTTTLKSPSAPLCINYYRIETIIVTGTSSNNVGNYSQKIGFP